MSGQNELAIKKARQFLLFVLFLVNFVVACLLLFASPLASANQAPVLDPIPVQQVFPEQIFVYRVTASDSDGGVPGIRMLNAPAGSSLNDLYDGTREFKWPVPVPAQLAEETVVIFQAFDAVDASLISTQRMVLTKAQPPQVNTDNDIVLQADKQSDNIADSNALPEQSEPATAGNSAPSLPDIGQQTLQVGQEYQLYIRPTDEDNTVPGLMVPSLPDGAVLEDAFDGSRLFRWTPGAGQIGEHRILLIAFDARDTSLRNEREVLFVVAGDSQTDSQADNQADVEADTEADNQTDSTTTIDITNDTLDGTTQSSDQLPFFEPISTQIVGVGQLVSFRVVPRMPDNAAAILHVDRLPDSASFDDNLDGTRTFYWPTSQDEQGEHIFRFTAIHPVDVSQRVSTEVMVVIGDPSAQGSEPAAPVDETLESDVDNTQGEAGEREDVSSQNQNQPPVINPIAPQRVQVATDLRFRVIATDADGNVPGLYLENAIGDIRFEDNGDGSREFIWRPGEQQVGTHTFEVIATDFADSSLFTRMPITVEVLSAENANDNQQVVPPGKLNVTARAQSSTDAARFLQRASFGPNTVSVNKLMQQTYSDWINDQMNIPQTRYLDGVDSVLREYGLINITDGRRQFDRQQIRSDIFWNIAVSAPDQLRQRVAFALGQILVVSDKDAGLDNRVRGIANYHDLLASEAFGNYRSLLGKVTLNPMMGDFLSMRRNEKPDLENNIQSDENYAREVMQLFTIGLTKLQLNGDAIIGADGQPSPTYTQEDVVNLARVFTGWNYGDASSMRSSARTTQSEIMPMKAFEAFHDTSAKTIVGNVTIEAGLSAQAELDVALDVLFNHPNTAPFVSRQLIQRLVSSNPSGDYIARVASVFNNNGDGVRGDMAAVVRAILLDDEALNGHTNKSWDFGKLKEPVVKIASIWRAFDAKGSFGKLRYSGINADFLQSPYSAPSVFNFYSANYKPPGIVGNENKVAPEAQILNDTTILRAADRLFDYAHQVPLGTASNSNQHAILLNIEAEKALANDVPKLVDHLRDKLLVGAMSDGLRSTLIELGNATPMNDNGEQRVRELLYVVFVSPEFAVQR